MLPGGHRRGQGSGSLGAQGAGPVVAASVQSSPGLQAWLHRALWAAASLQVSHLLQGNCKLLRTRKNCRNGHILKSDHNLSVLSAMVDHLTYTELCQLLLQNDPSLLPNICLHYNKGDGPFSSRSFQKQCIKLHICQYFLQGEYKFGAISKRSHQFTNSENLEKLERLGLSSDLVCKVFCLLECI